MLAALFYAGCREPQNPLSAGPPLRATITLVILFLGAFIIYPEATGVLVALMVVASLAAQRSLSSACYRSAVFGVALLVSALIDYHGSIRFFWGQLAFAVSAGGVGSRWFLYSVQPYFGYNFTDLFRNDLVRVQTMAEGAGPMAVIASVIRADPSTALLALNVPPILLGYYPIINVVSAHSIGLSAVVSVAISGAIVARLVSAGGHADDPSHRYLKSFVLAFAVMVSSFTFLAKPWQAGKAMTFIMPLVSPVLFAALVKPRADHRFADRLGLWLVLLFIGSSVSFAWARVAFAADPAAVGHASPFPSILRVEDKQRFRYAVPDRLKTCRSVVVHESHPNRALYLLLSARQYATSWIEPSRPSDEDGGQAASLRERRADCRLEFTEGRAATGPVSRIVVRPQ